MAMEPVSGSKLSSITGIKMTELAKLIEPMWISLNDTLTELLNFELKITAIKYDSPSHKDGFAADYAYKFSYENAKYPLANNRNPVWFLQPLLLNRLSILQFIKFEGAILRLEMGKHLVMRIGLFVEDNHFHCHIISARIVIGDDDTIKGLAEQGNIKFLPYRRTARGNSAYLKIIDKLSKEPFSE